MFLADTLISSLSVEARCVHVEFKVGILEVQSHTEVAALCCHSFDIFSFSLWQYWATELHPKLFFKYIF